MIKSASTELQHLSFQTSVLCRFYKSSTSFSVCTSSLLLFLQHFLGSLPRQSHRREQLLRGVFDAMTCQARRGHREPLVATSNGIETAEQLQLVHRFGGRLDSIGLLILAYLDHLQLFNRTHPDQCMNRLAIILRTHLEDQQSCAKLCKPRYGQRDLNLPIMAKLIPGTYCFRPRVLAVFATGFP